MSDLIDRLRAAIGGYTPASQSCMGACSTHPKSSTSLCAGCPMPPDGWQPPRSARVVELPEATP